MPKARTAAFLDAGRSVEDATDRVKLVESLGYDSVWTSHIAARDPLQLIAHWARNTERIRFGTAVTPIFLRHPALLAQEAATLDELSGGRFSLGIATSHK